MTSCEYSLCFTPATAARVVHTHTPTLTCATTCRDAWLAGHLDDSGKPKQAECTCASHTPLGQTLTTSPSMCSAASQSWCCQDLRHSHPGAQGPGGSSGLGPRWQHTRSAERWLSDLGSPERCSALIKVTGDLSDILVGHATWDSFTQVGKGQGCPRGVG
jgi:hypothetical protein